MTALELSHVSFLYSEKTPFEMQALRDVSISFPENSVTGIIGHTGSGKSTLVQMMNGLLRPSTGKVLVYGQDIWLKPKQITSVRHTVGLVMQYPEHQLFDETVRADIGFGPGNMGLTEKEVDARICEAAEFVGLDSELLDKSPFDLSGGQKRRAAIAGVLAMRPKILILDEPAAGLDPRGRSDILGKLREYRSRYNATVIFVSHSMEDMAEYCDRIMVMNKGELWMQGTVPQVFTHAKELADIGLSVPQVASLAAALRGKGVPLNTELCTVAQVKDALLALMKRGDASC